MDQSSEEIAQTFEIIDKAEAMPDSVCENDSTNNNEISTSDIQPSQTTNGENDDDNNNKISNKKYSRDQLIQMKQISSTLIPNLKKEVKNLLFKETSELDNTLNRTYRNDATMPNFANNLANRPYQKQRSTESGRRSQQGNRPPITIRLQSNEEIKLNESKNAWKPQLLASKDSERPEEELKTEELIKQFRSILNKLTPENFSTLVEKLKVLHIDTVDRLDTCISLVFEKAITEPNYASSYAILCKQVADVFIVPLDPNNTQQKAVFKKRLISQCQREFEKHRDNELIKNTAERLKMIEDEEDLVKKEEMKQEFYFESTKVRKRAVGTVHFIGELYKIEMLTSKIMRLCITHLLDSSMCSEETLECLCKLLDTVGKRLEKLDANKVDLSECFATLEKLADKKNPIGISSRIRFMIQDVIELRLNNWTPRRIHKENKPLTMDEIKQQVILEQAIKDMDNKDSIRESQDRGNRQNQRRTGAINEEGWSTPYSKSRPVKFDPLKLPTNASDDIKLGQPSNFQNFSNFQSNRFAGLKEEDQFQEQSNRNYNGRFSGGTPNMNNNQNRNNTFDNRNNRNNNRGNRSAGSKSLQASSLQGNQGKFGSSRNTNNVERHRNPSMQFFNRQSDLSMKGANTLPRKISAPARPMQYSDAFIQERTLINDPEKVLNITKSSIKGYQHKESTMEEIIENLRKFKINKDSLLRIINWIFDHHDDERLTLSEIICEAVCRNVIMVKELLDAMKEIIELAQDLVCDLPLVYSYIGQLLALPLAKRIIYFKDLLEISKSQIETNNGEIILKNVFRIIEQQHGKDSFLQLYNEANIDFQMFLDQETPLNDFLNANNFAYLIQEVAPETVVPAFDEELKKTLEEKMNVESDVEAIILWITSNIKERDNSFIRVLMELILKRSIEKLPDGSYKLEREKLDIGASLLTQFVEKSKEKQIECLKVIHHFMNELEHPSGCLNDILSCLYDNFALSKSAFFKWHDDSDPLEQEGKGVALKSIHPFIQYLKNEKDDDESTGDEN